MKIKEMMIKIVSFALCFSAVSAVFAVRERDARRRLTVYETSVREEKLADLRYRVSELKTAVSDIAAHDGAAAEEAVYRCKAASDAAYRAYPAIEGDGMRALFYDIGQICESIGASGPDYGRLLRLSDAYGKLCALEKELYNAEPDPSKLSAPVKEKDADQSEEARISSERAEKLARAAIGKRVTLRYREHTRYGTVFSSDGSYAAITNGGDLISLSVSKTSGKTNVGLREAEKTALAHISEKTGGECGSEFLGLMFGVYYFRIYCKGNEYPVGVDCTDGSIVFETDITLRSTDRGMPAQARCRRPSDP